MGARLRLIRGGLRERASIVGGRLTRWGRWGGNPAGAGDVWYSFGRFGVRVPATYTPLVALELPAVQNAIGLIAAELAALPMSVQARRSDGGWDAVEWRDPDVRVLTGRWEAWRTAEESLRGIVQSVLLHGFAALWVVRDSSWRLRELVLLDPERVTRDGQYGRVRYMHAGPVVEGVPRGELARENLVWLEPQVSLDRTRQPESVFAQAWPPIRAGIAAQRFNARYFEMGARPDVFLVNDDQHATQDVEKLQDVFGRGFDRMRREGRREFPLPRGWKAQTVSGTPRESQLDQRFVEATAVVAQLTRISPILLGNLGRATFSNYDQAIRTFVQQTLHAWARMVANQVSWTVWPRGRRRLWLDTSDPGDEDRLTTARRLRDLIFAGVLTQDEARGILELDPKEDGQSDVLARTPSLPEPPQLVVHPDVNLGGGDGFFGD